MLPGPTQEKVVTVKMPNPPKWFLFVMQTGLYSLAVIAYLVMTAATYWEGRM